MMMDKAKEELIKLMDHSRLLQNKIYENEIKILDSEIEEIKFSKALVGAHTHEYTKILEKEQQLLIKKDLKVNEYANFLQDFINETK